MVRLLRQPTDPIADAPLEVFRAEAVTFLDAAAPAHRPESGSDLAALRAARRWQRRRFDAGFGWIDGPAAYGGRGLSAAHARSFSDLERSYPVPDRAPLAPGLGVVARTLLEHAGDHLRHLYLPALFRGDVAACPLFRSPGGVIDIAALRVTAVPDGPAWRLEGELWSTHAHLCDVGLVLARTHAGGARSGLTMFVLDLDQPGVDLLAAPMGGAAADAGLHLVMLQGAVAPASATVGIPGSGWQIAASLERGGARTRLAAPCGSAHGAFRGLQHV